MSSFSSIIAQEELLDHARRSSYRKKMECPSAKQEEYNPLCGDRITVYVRLDDRDGIESMTFEGSGCIISQAAASLLAEYVRGKNVDDVAKLERDTMETLIGGELSPSRVKCAMLPLVALKTALGIS